jgi:hypothetical protein
MGSLKEYNATVYPTPQLVGSKFLFNKEERNLILKNLQANWNDIDEQLKPYLIKINANPHLVTVFSCWGHLKGERDNEFHQPGNLFFRADLEPGIIFNKILIPMIQEFAPTGLIGSATPWVWFNPEDLPRIGYLIGEINQYCSDEQREKVFKFFIQLADTL